RHVAAAARAAGAKMVHVSTCDAIGFGAPDQPADEETTRYAKVSTPYVVTKQEAEQVVQEEVQRGLSAAIVNPGFMLGPWDWKPSSGQMLVEVGGGRGWVAPRGWTSVSDPRDVAAATIAALEQGEPGRRYILAGENMTYLELWRRIAEVTGARRPLFSLGPVNAAIVGGVGDLWTRLSGNEPVFNSAAIKMAKVPKIYSSARAKQELGYHNRPLQESITDGWNWFREHGYVRREA
ncbi:MAG: NAD-dependent epimerase/dehydratase family protein, partial [Pirellulales bacterium]